MTLNMYAISGSIYVHKMACNCWPICYTHRFGHEFIMKNDLNHATKFNLMNEIHFVVNLSLKWILFSLSAYFVFVFLSLFLWISPRIE